MTRTLELKFRKVDGTGSRTIKIPNPPADINTKTTEITNYMTTYAEGFVLDYPIFDEAHIVEHTETQLIDLID